MNSKVLLAILLPAMVVLTLPALCAAQVSATAPSMLTRRYQEGEKLNYHMKTTNRDRNSVTSYEVDAVGVVKKNSSGRFVEEYAWSNLIVNNKPAVVTPAMQAFRQTLSLDPGAPPSIPDLSQVVSLVGPITDMLTFYADLWLSARLNKFAERGDHFYFAGTANTPNSWADGAHTLIGEDVVAFDITLIDVDLPHNVATLRVNHVPPANPQIKLPAEWMRTPVADTPNNWVQLQKNSDGKYAGMVGKETFDVQLKVSLNNGKNIVGDLRQPSGSAGTRLHRSGLNHLQCAVPLPNQAAGRNCTAITIVAGLA